MSGFERFVDLLLRRRKAVIAIVLVLVLAVGAGAAEIEESTEMEMFADEPAEVETERFVQEAFTPYEENTTQLVVMVRNESGSVLERDSLLHSLEYQQALHENETVNATLVEEGAILGVENLVATAAIMQERNQAQSEQAQSDQLARDELPPLDQQVAQLEAMSDAEVEAVVTALLDPGSAENSGDGDSPDTAVSNLALDLLPEDYEPGSTDADGRLIVVTHETDGLVVSIPELSEEVRDGQVTADVLADDVPRDEYRMTGYGLMLVEEEASIDDSLTLVGPLALLFVLGTLAVAYRDLLDIALGLVGIVLVLLWTFGVMGWLGIDFTLMMIAVPILLIGLSIDYSIHVVMRYREERTGNGVGEGAVDGDSQPQRGIRAAMNDSMVGLGPALVLVTVTAMLGFLSILTSDIPILGDFGVVTSAGIFGALVVFGVLVPACKVELEEWLEQSGYRRKNRAVGTTGRTRTGLKKLARVSYQRPVAIVMIVLLVSSMGAVGATQLETDFSTDDYIAEDPPEWTEHLPESLQPSEYELRETHEMLYSSFQSPDQQVHIVSQGNVTSSETLQAIAAAEEDAAQRPVTVDRPTGEPAVTGPVSAMWAVAESNESFGALLRASDTTTDGVPDENTAAVLDAFYGAAPDQADRLLHRTDDGVYEGAQIAVTVDGTEDPSTVADEMRATGEIADEMQAVGDVAESEGNTVTVAGEPIRNELVQRQLATTTVEGLTVALVTVLAVLLVAFRYKRSSASLGAVTLLPVLFGLSWILGAMYVLGLPFSFATAIIGSIVIGLGVDYAIHMSERFGHELDKHGDTETALEESVVGTGGALLGSAATTAGGFGVLAFSMVPIMQQFGILIALTLVTAFVASVVVLPSLLVLWSRWNQYEELRAKLPRRSTLSEKDA